MRFSIIVPAYNCEKFLAECIKSVLQQTVNSDFEIILIDDGSTDSTARICDEFQRDSSLVHAYHIDNAGPYAARAYGMRQAVGDYAVFLDADDMLRRDALEIISEAIDSSKADIVAFRFSRTPDFSTVDDMISLAAGKYFGPDYDTVKRHVCHAHFNNLCGKAFRLSRTIEGPVSDEPSSKYIYAEDLLQLLPLIDSSKSLMSIDQALYFYRPNDSSTSGTYKRLFIDNTEYVCKRLLAYGDSWGMRPDALSGVYSLYVGVLKPLVDYAEPSIVEDEILRLGVSLRHISPDVIRGLCSCRLDYRLMLTAAVNGDAQKAVTLVHLSHLARRVKELIRGR